MYHYAKSGRKKKKQNKALGSSCLLLALLLGALIFWAMAPASRQEPGTMTLLYRGQPRQVPLEGECVAELLEALGLELTAEDALSPSEDTPLAPGMRVIVERRQRRRETYTLALEPEREYQLDSDLPWGQEALLLPGEPGEIRCTAWVDYVNGREIGREIIEKKLIRPAQNELVAIGTCENPLPTGENGYLWLTDGQMLTYTHTATVEATGFTGTDAGAASDACWGTVLVNPDFIAPGTRLYVVSADGLDYGVAQAQAGNLQGRRMDLYFPTAQQRDDFGRQECTVYFLGG